MVKVGQEAAVKAAMEQVNLFGNIPGFQMPGDAGRYNGLNWADIPNMAEIQA